MMTSLKTLRSQNFGRSEPYIYRGLRRLSVLLSYVCVRLDIAPNLITVLSTGAAVIAAMLLATGDSLLVRLAAIAVVISYILDCMDGEIARASGRESILGIQLEHMTSWMIIGLLQSGAAIGVLRTHHNPLLLMASFASLVSWYGLYFFFLQLRLWIPKESKFGALRGASRIMYALMPMDQNLLVLFAAGNVIVTYLIVSACLSSALLGLSCVLFLYYTNTEQIAPPAVALDTSADATLYPAAEPDLTVSER